MVAWTCKVATQGYAGRHCPLCMAVRETILYEATLLWKKKRYPIALVGLLRQPLSLILAYPPASSMALVFIS